MSIRVASASVLLAVCVAPVLPEPCAASAQAATAAPRRETARSGSLHGTVAATEDTITLPGVPISVVTPEGHEVTVGLSSADGRYRLPGLPAGTYTIVVRLDGFERFEQRVTLGPGEDREFNLRLRLAGVREQVDVVRSASVEVGISLSTPMGTRSVVDGSALSGSALVDGSIQAAISMMPGVVTRGTALSIRGGRPNQSRMQVDGTNVTDPASGESWYRLPGDAASVVEVLASPPAVEFGRFASGLTVIQTRRGGPKWQASVNNLEPGLVTRRGHPWQVVGLESVSPRVVVGGPIVKDRVFVTESAQLRYMSSELQSRPQDERRKNLNFSTFTRVDTSLGQRNSLTGTLGWYTKRVSALNLDTFTPPGAAADTRYRALVASMREMVQVGTSWVAESQFQWALTSTATDPRGSGDSLLAPDERRGAYFNTQDRRSVTWAWSETVTGVQSGRWGQHLFKAGLDVMGSRYEGSSSSRGVDIVDAAGVAVTHIAFGGGRPQLVPAMDVALFAQERWQPVGRFQVELGVRADRDGVTRSYTLSPRVGAMLALRKDQSTTIRAGIGVFCERTPSMAAAFPAFEPRTEWPLAADGHTPAGPSVTWIPRVVGPLEAARSRSWDIGIDHRLARGLTMRAQVLGRSGSRDLLVDPSGSGPVRWLDLSSRGRSVYRDAEVSVRYHPGPPFEGTVTYTRSSSTADLNAFSTMFDLIRDPVLRPSAYAPTPLDVPHRLVLRTRASLGPRWMAEAALTWRSGFPWTPLAADLQYIGAPNQQRRFPAWRMVDLSFERRVKFWKVNGWIGLVVFNALNEFAPSDVQANVGSPRFGWYFNREPRQLRFGFRMH